DPYKITPADIACVFRGRAFVTEKNVFERVITGIRAGDEIGYKYFDFGDDFSSKTMLFTARVHGLGCNCKMHIYADDEEIGVCEIGHGDGVVESVVKCVTGRHAVYFKITTDYPDPDSDVDNAWMGNYFKERDLFELVEFTFMK
ncbi:MAG: xylan 1,4-beta-xylosidase, partial [Oscillospiraceae bacterium]|nr:xylan 1,4-beta-xylosidase [Oscillospiraceae bacterium]